MFEQFAAVFRRVMRYLGWRPKEVRPRTDAQRRGDEGERRALVALRKGGMRLLARNWRAHPGELDLIMREGKSIVFVEVRTHHGSPEKAYFSVRRRKRQVLRRTAKAYLKSLRPRPVTVRFDLVAVDLDDLGPEGIHHFRGLPLFGKNFKP